MKVLNSIQHPKTITVVVQECEFIVDNWVKYIAIDHGGAMYGFSDEPEWMDDIKTWEIPFGRLYARSVLMANVSDYGNSEDTLIKV